MYILQHVGSWACLSEAGGDFRDTHPCLPRLHGRGGR